MTKTAKKQVNISNELHQALKTAADERGIGVSLLAEKGIAEFIDRLIPVDEIVLTRPAEAEQVKPTTTETPADDGKMKFIPKS